MSTEELSFFMLKCCFTSTETVGLLGTGAQDGHLDFHTAPELSQDVSFFLFFFLFSFSTGQDFPTLSSETSWSVSDLGYNDVG